MEIVTYIQKVRDRDGNEYHYTHKCEILKFVGKKSVKIRIHGTVYNGRPNAVLIVRKKSIVELKNHTYHEQIK